LSNLTDRHNMSEITSQRLIPLRGDDIPQPPPEDRLDLHGLLAMLERRKVVIFAVMAAVVVLAMLVSALQTPKYSALSQVVLNTNEEQLAPANSNVLTKTMQTQELADTEVEVLRSRELARHVTEALRLDRDPKYRPSSNGNPGRLRRLGEALGLVTPQPAVQLSSEAVSQTLINRLLSYLSISRVGQTYAFNILVTSDNPAEAQRIANEYATQYTRLYTDRKRDSNNDAVTFLSSRLAELQRQAQADTALVQQYRVENNLLSSSGASLTEQEISTYNQQVAAARTQAAEDRAKLATALGQLRGGSLGDDVGEALGSPVISALRGQRAQVSAQFARLSNTYGPLYPEVQRARTELADVDAQIQAEIKRVISNLQARATVSQDRLSSIEGTLGGARNQLAANNRAMVGLDDLQRRAEASQQLYDSYLARYKETRAREGTERPEARVTSWADLPMSPSSPRTELNLLLALVIGTGLGLATALISEMMFAGLTTPSDVESRLRIRCLGGIPLLNSVLPKARSPVDAVINYPASSYAEAFRSLRGSIKWAVDGPSKVIMITSALPKEGKTTTSVCMARMSALSGERVVLIDVDVRQRDLSTTVPDVEGRPDLIKILTGDATLDEALVRDGMSGAFVLPIRETPGEIGDLLIGPAMDSLIAQLRDRFDVVLLDSAPVLASSDTRSLAAKVDAVVVIARWRSTAEHIVREALRMLPYHHVPIAGIVLTKVNVHKNLRYGYGDKAYVNDSSKTKYFA
jgi:capsular exopolysaccharide synthesis family protein